MLDFEQAYNRLEQSRGSQYISLYDLFLFIRSHNPNLSDNKIATVLISALKDYKHNFDKLEELGFYGVLGDDQKKEFSKIAPLGEPSYFTFPKRLHEAPLEHDFDDLLHILKSVEDNGIFETIPF